METQNEYIPGVCNIGPAETKRRMVAGWIGLIITVLLWAASVLFNIPAVFRLIVFFPSMLSAVGFIQARMHFCTHFGFSGLFNFGKVGKTEKVDKVEFRALDRKKAWMIIAYSVIAALAVAIIAYAS